MKDQISFMSGKFETAPSVPPVANDLHFGRDLATWMAGKSSGSEFVFEEPVETTTGWSERVTTEGEKYTLGFGLIKGSESNYAHWLITIDSPRSWLSFRRKDSSIRSRLCDHIHNVLRDEREIRDVQWD